MQNAFETLKLSSNTHHTIQVRHLGWGRVRPLQGSLLTMAMIPSMRNVIARNCSLDKVMCLKVAMPAQKWYIKPSKNNWKHYHTAKHSFHSNPRLMLRICSETGKSSTQMIFKHLGFPTCFSPSLLSSSLSPPPPRRNTTTAASKSPLSWMLHIL